MKEKLDNIHIDFSTIDGADKDLNFVIASRHIGKTTTFLVRKSYPAWKNRGRSTILLFRMIADISQFAIDYYLNLMNKYLDKPLTAKISDAACSKGIVPVIPEGYERPIFWAVALSCGVTRLKKTAIPDAEFMLFDELEIDPRNKEKYLKNEFQKFQALYDTQLKFSKCKFYGLTNPYSVVNPYFRGLGIETKKIVPTAFLKGSNWALWYPRLSKELASKLKAENPLYKEDDEYTQMAFDGEMVNDLNNHVEPMRGSYSLQVLFRFEGEQFGVYMINPFDPDETKPTFYIKKDNTRSRRRDIYAFEFEDMICGTSLVSNREKNRLAHLKQAIRSQDFAVDDMITEHALQSIFNYL